MHCPKCKSEDCEPNQEPLKNLGGKVKEPGYNIRRYQCQQCGYAFKSLEEPLAPIRRQSTPTSTEQPTTRA